MDFSSRNPATSNALNLAARNNDVSNVERLLKKINPNCVDNRGWTCLHEAAYHDSYESLMLILKSHRCRPLAETHEGHTALYLACKKKCSLRTVTALLNSADDIANYGSTEGVTPLHIAASQGSVQLIELLLDYGAIIDVQDFDGDTPLHDAAIAIQNEALVTLLYAGANPEIRNEPSCFTPFHLACSRGFYPNVESLFPFITNINQVTSSGESPLMMAIQGLNDDIIYFLLKNGADPNIINDYGQIAIDIALSSDASPGVFETLLAMTDKDVLSKGLIGHACMPHCFKFENLDILLTSDLGPEFFEFSEPFNKELYEVDSFEPCYRTNAPLNSYLNICGYINTKSPEKFKEFFYLFLMRGVQVNVVDGHVCPPLVYAHYVNTTCFNDVFEILIEHGCDVDYCSSTMWYRGYRIPDAFLASLTLYPPSMSVMMPYSLYCEPGDFLQFAYERGQLNIIPQQVQRELLLMVDPNFHSITAESLSYHVFSLKHLCRYRIRSIFREDDSIRTTKHFLSALNTLPIPKMIKNYLRYL